MGAFVDTFPSTGDFILDTDIANAFAVVGVTILNWPVFVPLRERSPADPSVWVLPVIEVTGAGVVVFEIAFDGWLTECDVVSEISYFGVVETSVFDGEVAEDKVKSVFNEPWAYVVGRGVETDVEAESVFLATVEGDSVAIEGYFSTVEALFIGDFELGLSFFSFLLFSVDSWTVVVGESVDPGNVFFRVVR